MSIKNVDFGDYPARLCVKQNVFGKLDCNGCLFEGDMYNVLWM